MPAGTEAQSSRANGWRRVGLSPQWFTEAVGSAVCGARTASLYFLIYSFTLSFTSFFTSLFIISLFLCVFTCLFAAVMRCFRAGLPWQRAARGGVGAASALSVRALSERCGGHGGPLRRLFERLSALPCVPSAVLGGLPLLPGEQLFCSPQRSSSRSGCHGL